MFSYEEAQELIKLPKRVEIDGILQNALTFEQPIPFIKKYILLSDSNENVSFLYDIKQSKKFLLKLTLYLMDDETKIGLVRVDYNGQHDNPIAIKDTVPTIFHKYAGKHFDYNEHHIHYYVEGYRTTLDWAIPLLEDSFPVKEIKNNQDVLNAFYDFNELINLKTTFNISEKLL
ncbi:DUF6978 family protein [Melioribacter sp. Ez-97]|uniref:DUF6978 family protein n=1 Tax=Melioribacter sp. Ez-97 TaxID=3423434 RepID=UPI003ED962F3